MNIKGAPTHFAAHFTVFGPVTIIFWSRWGEIDDVISIIIQLLVFSVTLFKIDQNKK